MPLIQETPYTEPLSEQKITASKLAQELGYSSSAIKKTARSLRQDHPDWFPVNLQHEHSYSLELANAIRDHYTKADYAPNTWKIKSELAKELEWNKSGIKRIAETFRRDHPEWFKDYRIEEGRRIFEHYSPELIEEIVREINKKRHSKKGNTSPDLEKSKINFAPEGWKTNRQLAGELRSDKKTIKKIANLFRKDHPDWFEYYLTRDGHRIFEHYSPELILKVSEVRVEKSYPSGNETKQLESAPEGWIIREHLATKLDSNSHAIKKWVKHFRKDYPEEFKIYKDKNGRALEHISPKLVALISDKLNSKNFESIPKGWMTVNSLRRQIGHSILKIQKIGEPYRKDHPEWFKDYPIEGRYYEHYSPELVKLIIEDFYGIESASEGWITINKLAKELGCTWDTVKQVAELFRKNHPEWFEKKRDEGGRVKEHISLELTQLVKETLNKTEQAPEGWVTRGGLADKLGWKSETIGKIAEKSRGDHPEWFHYYLTKKRGYYEHYSPQLVELIQIKISEIKPAPENWVTRNTLARKLGIKNDTIERISQKFREMHSEWFKDYLTERHVLCEHYSPELVIEIKRNIDDREKKSGKSGEQINISETIESKEFRVLINLFGPGAATDILYKYHPEFRGVPIGHMRSIIADYLGDFLIEKHGFSPKDLQYIDSLNEDDVGLMNNLFEIMKQDCLLFHQRNRHSGSGSIQERLEQYRKEIGQNQAVLKIVERVAKYYDAISILAVPENMVNQLREGREFPDFNQKINVQEIKDKHRMLIADYMGLGKSASTIVAKEHLHCGTCIVVTPNNVIGTWKGYLGSGQGGYFKPEQEPDVLILNAPSDLEKLDSNTYDYILISQEKLNNRYAKALVDLDYDMLIVDEVHKLKNLKGGVRSNNLVSLAQKIEGENKFLVMLSGTPIPNKIKDIAVELKLLYPDKFSAVDDATLIEKIVNDDTLSLRELLLPRMQRKGLGSSFEMPKLDKLAQPVILQGPERDIYELLLEEDEISASQKLQLLRQFLLNPEIVHPTPDFNGSKVEAASSYLQKEFERKNKIVFFVNGYVEGIIRGETSIVSKLNLPSDISVKIIEGNVDPDDRTRIQKEFKETQGKVLLIVSGQTADVGVDFSVGESIYFYNEPWNQADKDQQTSRVYREGIKNDLEVTTSIATGTIEEGIHRYLSIKQQAIEKIILGIPNTELEKQLLAKDEPVLDENLEVNPELARYYLSSVDKMLKIFSYVKEMGEKDFQKFLEQFGREYADCYLDIGSRSYQGNNSRLTATLLKKMIEERNQDKKDVKILDIASGPEMLRRHSSEDLESRVFSMDINKHHFEGNKTDKAIAGSFLKLPFANESIDYVNLGFALHYTKFLPSRGEYERIEVLKEMNRILNEGGRAVITLVHSLDFKNEGEFKKITAMLGFQIVDEYSGKAESGNQYHSTIITLEKVNPGENKESKTSQDLAKELNKEQLAGLKFVETDSTLKDSRHIIDTFKLNNQEYHIGFNHRDQVTFHEQKDYTEIGKSLIEIYGTIEQIPTNQIINNGFARLVVGKRFILFKKMTGGGGAVVIREK